MYIFIIFRPYSFNDESNSPPGFSIAYFISEDLQIFNGVYSVFKYKLTLNLRLLLTLLVYNKCKNIV